jgi:hypothetical protein
MRSSAGQHLRAKTQQPRSSNGNARKRLKNGIEPIMPVGLHCQLAVAADNYKEQSERLTKLPFPCQLLTWPPPARMQLETLQALALDVNSHSNGLARTYRIHILQHVVTNHPQTCETAAGSLRIQLRQRDTRVKWRGRARHGSSQIHKQGWQGMWACVCECRLGDMKGALTCILHAMSMKYMRTNASAMLQAAVREQRPTRRAVPSHTPAAQRQQPVVAQHKERVFRAEISLGMGCQTMSATVT